MNTQNSTRKKYKSTWNILHSLAKSPSVSLATATVGRTQNVGSAFSVNDFARLISFSFISPNLVPFCEKGREKLSIFLFSNVDCCRKTRNGSAALKHVDEERRG